MLAFRLPLPALKKVCAFLSASLLTVCSDVSSSCSFRRSDWDKAWAKPEPGSAAFRWSLALSNLWECWSSRFCFLVSCFHGIDVTKRSFENVLPNGKSSCGVDMSAISQIGRTSLSNFFCCCSACTRSCSRVWALVTTMASADTWDVIAVHFISNRCLSTGTISTSTPTSMDTDRVCNMAALTAKAMPLTWMFMSARGYRTTSPCAHWRVTTSPQTLFLGPIASPGQVYHGTRASMQCQRGCHVWLFPPLPLFMLLTLHLVTPPPVPLQPLPVPPHTWTPVHVPAPLIYQSHT